MRGSGGEVGCLRGDGGEGAGGEGSGRGVDEGGRRRRGEGTEGVEEGRGGRGEWGGVGGCWRAEKWGGGSCVCGQQVNEECGLDGGGSLRDKKSGGLGEWEELVLVAV
ncbi:hypothetical protein Tco_0998144 [Tanacetum coccineum]